MCSKLRPHHGLCIAFFEGKGYSSSFVRHMEEVIGELEKNPQIQLMPEEDSICAGCPNAGRKGCSTREKVRAYDKEVLTLCGLEAGERISWKQFQKKVREHIIEAGNMAQVCGDCGWAEICHNREHKKDRRNSGISRGCDMR